MSSLKRIFHAQDFGNGRFCLKMYSKDRQHIGTIPMVLSWTSQQTSSPHPWHRQEAPLGCHLMMNTIWQHKARTMAFHLESGSFANKDAYGRQCCIATRRFCMVSSCVVVTPNAVRSAAPRIHGPKYKRTADAAAHHARCGAALKMNLAPTELGWAVWCSHRTWALNSTKAALQQGRSRQFWHGYAICWCYKIFFMQNSTTPWRYFLNWPSQNQ